MKSILFFATYPTKDNIKDGMIQSIKAVDWIAGICHSATASL